MNFSTTPATPWSWWTLPWPSTWFIVFKHYQLSSIIVSTIDQLVEHSPSQSPYLCLAPQFEAYEFGWSRGCKCNDSQVSWGVILFDFWMSVMMLVCQCSFISCGHICVPTRRNSYCKGFLRRSLVAKCKDFKRPNEFLRGTFLWRWLAFQDQDEQFCYFATLLLLVLRYDIPTAVSCSFQSPNHVKFHVFPPHKLKYLIGYWSWLILDFCFIHVHHN